MVSGLSFLLAELLGGCATTMRNEQLARVAKDWSLVVRASQVVPVYPPTEDLVPGDIFLVRMSIPQQHREYQKWGFLPMDMHLTRLKAEALDYNDVYDGSYGIQGKKNTPYHWQFPPDGKAPDTVEDLLRFLQPPQAATGAGPQAGGGAIANRTGSGKADPNKPQPRQDFDPTLWRTAPRAAFPSYTFKVDSRGGIQAALPIQGVPVALSMMQTDAAFGSVTLSDAYTYGVPYDRLFADVNEWMDTSGCKATLVEIRQGVNRGNMLMSHIENFVKCITLDKNERTVYLRVVSRVYVVGSVNVALINARQGTIDIQAGVPRAIELLDVPLTVPKTPQESSQPAAGADAKKADAAQTNLVTDANKAASNFQKALEAVNANLGGAVKLQCAGARSVALDERFPRPLVIGYIGFDFPINADGTLGAPIATQYQLERGSGTKKSPDTATTEQRRRVGRWLKKDHGTRVQELDSWLAKRGIDASTDTWVAPKAALKTDMTDAIRDLKITE